MVSFVHCWPLKTLICRADNNDGISVIDVTDPLHPAYCFIHDRHFSIPVSAYVYLSEDSKLQGEHIVASRMNMNNPL